MLGPAEFDFLRGLVRERSAIVLEPGKEYLVESRLVPLLRDRQLPSLATLAAALRADPRGELERAVVEAMTTNETSFFRDHHPFEALQHRLLPELIAARASERRLRFWSNACSSGQEAYSLAMLLAEHFPGLRAWDVSILATDLSRDMVRRTQQASYGQLEMNRGLPAPLLVKYFDRQGTRWQVKPDLRRWVQAREMNLMEGWPPLPRFDVIFLRNVLIYFDLDTKRAILRRARQALRPDGFLLLGSAETTVMVDDAWERVVVGGSVAYRAGGASLRAAGSAA
ncbi:MAG: protein-glutamate O-methyltransferase CheR [Gemmatimonadetes bacterium]|nr:protein-glutamate O-methyltransferase CheR [Gemmatimonadota bacterium]MBK7924918.1 protein-glutamate O-methyltransferase CheR [Gemmatimonadota bacterium]